MCAKSSASWCPPVKHERDHGDPTERLAGLGKSFIIFREPTLASEPGKAPLDHPASGEHLKTMLVSPLHNTEHPAGKGLRPLDQLASIATVGPDQPQPAKTIFELRQHQRGPVPVLNVSRMHHDSQQQPERIHRQVTLASSRFFAGIVAPRAPFSVVLTVWLSRIAARGVGARRACSRSASMFCSRRR